MIMWNIVITIMWNSQLNRSPECINQYLIPTKRTLEESPSNFEILMETAFSTAKAEEMFL